ncbi:helix-turn-helix domain-containing protein [soil metagenome]
MSKIIHTHQLKKNTDGDLPFNVEWLGARSGYSNREAHRHGYYEVFLFEKGGGKHIIDFESYAIESQSVHFIQPGQVHQLLRKSETSGCVIIFSEDFYYLHSRENQSLNSFPFFQPDNDSPSITTADLDFAELSKIAQDLYKVLNTDNAHKVALLQSYLQIFLLQIWNVFDKLYPEINHPLSAGKRLVSSFKSLLERDVLVEHQVAFYAGQLHVTPTYLNMACKKVLGKQASEIIKERLILEAKRMLLFSELSGKEVAYELNFIDPSHFGRFFKNQTGMSPLQFIKKESLR